MTISENTGPQGKQKQNPTAIMKKHPERKKKGGAEKDKAEPKEKLGDYLVMCAKMQKFGPHCEEMAKANRPLGIQEE